MSGNRRRTPRSDERVVVFVCTGGDSHPRRKLGVVALREGMAVGGKGLRKAIVASAVAREAPGVQISEFDFRCAQCGKHYQRRQETMRGEVGILLATHPQRMRVVRDISVS